ncbi:hypothetical protein F383_39433 [Gossypium arboreum]|uniref:Uncharacterized protein n=1 Tax=Gossypium arboreum TaxID=29729 RepID=A0A0B0MU68_GOSAR|nr:hypothetical protein F383_39433 [Gossypium arboreum]
MPLISLSLSLG